MTSCGLPRWCEVTAGERNDARAGSDCTKATSRPLPPTVDPRLHECRRRVGSEHMAVPDEMGLIEVAGIDRDVCPAAIRLLALSLQHVSEPDNSMEQLGSDPDLVTEHTLELAGAHQRRRRHRPNVTNPSAIQEGGGRRLYRMPRSTSLKSRQEERSRCWIISVTLGLSVMRSWTVRIAGPNTSTASGVRLASCPI